MTEPLFHVIADGHPAAGFDAATVLQQLAEKLKLAPAQAQRLLGGQPVVAKRAVTRAIAEKYCTRLSALGVQVHIEADAAIPSNAAPAAHTATPTDWPELSDFFAGIATPIAGMRNSARYLQRLFSTGTRILWIALAYSGIVLLGLAILIFYSWHFRYLLTAPPLLFSIPVFVIPWLVLLLTTALLLRPVYPQSHTPPAAVTLHPHSQPQLFHWLAQLCELIGAPMPQEVAIGTQVVDSVMPHTSVKDFWRGHYRLTLSLPALDNNTLSNSSAMLASTLGTQARPAALRCQRALQILSARFDACLENRDWFSEKIARLEAGISAKKLAFAFSLLRRAISLHNQLIALFSQALASVRLKSTRYTLLEADRLQALLVGTENFTENLLRQHKLTEASRDADILNRQDRGDAMLVGDLPALIRFYVENFEPKMEQQLRQQWREVIARDRDALPTPGERIEAVQKCNTNALLTSSLPTTTLLTRPAVLAAQVTQTFYAALDLTFDDASLSPVDDVIFAATEDLLHRQQATLYFNNWFKVFRFWRVADYTLIRDMPTADAAQQLNVCISEIRRLTPDRMRLLNEYERLQNQIQELLVGQLVLAQGRNFQFRYVVYDGTNLQPLLEERQQQMAKIMEQLATQETIMGGRITLGLRLSGQAAGDAENLHKALQLGAGLENRLYKLSLDVFQLEQLLQRQARREADYGLPIKRLEERVNDASLLLLERLKEIPYPLDTSYATLRDYVEKLLGKSQSLPATSPVLDRARRLLNILYTFNEVVTRLAADSGTIAEEAYNIEPIKLIGSM